MPVAPAPPRYPNLSRLISRCLCNSSAHILLFSWPRKLADYASLFIFRRCIGTHFVSCYSMGDSLSVRLPHRYRYSSLPSEATTLVVPPSLSDSSSLLPKLHRLRLLFGSPALLIGPHFVSVSKYEGSLCRSLLRRHDIRIFAV
jgi:hypothetical protein